MPERAMQLLANVPDTTDDEAALVRKAQANPAAFGTLYLAYLDRVYRYLRSRTANEDEASDLAQQVFARALAALPRYRDQHVPFASWLFRIARNVAIDTNRRRRVTIAWDLLPEVFQSDLALDVEQLAMRREDATRLRALLADLDVEKRELLALRFAAGLTASQIAVAIGKSDAATKKQLARLMQSLREKYHDQAR